MAAGVVVLPDRVRRALAATSMAALLFTVNGPVHRSSLDVTVRAAVAQKPDPSLLEIGSRARSGNVYRGWFPEKLDYVGMDVHAGPNVDVVGDAHHLSRCVNRRFDFMFSMGTFEHILMPWKVALEMNKTLNDGGQALIISHPSWPLHDEPWDFFRFSKDSWHGIFNVHTGFRVVDAQYQFQASIVPIFSNAPHLDNMSTFPTYLLSSRFRLKPRWVIWRRLALGGLIALSGTDRAHKSQRWDPATPARSLK